MPTSPASTPFMMISTFGLRWKPQVISRAARPPATGARTVLIRMRGISGLSRSVLPALNPNQPTHSRKTPSTATGRL